MSVSPDKSVPAYHAKGYCVTPAPGLVLHEDTRACETQDNVDEDKLDDVKAKLVPAGEEAAVGERGHDVFVVEPYVLRRREVVGSINGGAVWLPKA